MSTPEDQVSTDSAPQGALATLQAPEVSPSGRAWGESYLKAHPEGVDTTGEASLLQRQDADAQEARTALQKARERLASQRMDPSILGLRFAQAMMSPSRYGVQDQWSKAAGAVADWRQQNQEFQQNQGAQDVGLAEKLAGVRQTVSCCATGAARVKRAHTILLDGYGVESDREAIRRRVAYWEDG